VCPASSDIEKQKVYYGDIEWKNQNNS
jgi:hypothetical protein